MALLNHTQNFMTEHGGIKSISDRTVREIENSLEGRRERRANHRRNWSLKIKISSNCWNDLKVALGNVRQIVILINDFFIITTRAIF